MVEFYTVSKRLKIRRLRGLQGYGRLHSPPGPLLTDAMRKGAQSVPSCRGLKKREIPDKVFIEESLRTLQN